MYLFYKIFTGDILRYGMFVYNMIIEHILRYSLFIENIIIDQILRYIVFIANIIKNKDILRCIICIYLNVFMSMIIDHLLRYRT